MIRFGMWTLAAAVVGVALWLNPVAFLGGFLVAFVLSSLSFAVMK